MAAMRPCFCQPASPNPYPHHASEDIYTSLRPTNLFRLENMALKENICSILTIDAGSFLEISQFRILSEIEYRIAQDTLRSQTYLWQYFGIMGGAGRAGLIVILLGRLRLAVEEARIYFFRIMNAAFQDSGKGNTNFNEQAFKRTLEDILEELGLPVDARMLEEGDNQCKVFICVGSYPFSTHHPTLIRSYNSRTHPTTGNWTIVEAAIASCALSGPVSIGGQEYNHATGEGRNPANFAIEEAIQQFSVNGNLCCVVSVGAAKGGELKFTDKHTEFARESIADCESVHGNIEKIQVAGIQGGFNRFYYRFSDFLSPANCRIQNQEQGIASSGSYLKDQTVTSNMDTVVALLISKVSQYPLVTLLHYPSSMSEKPLPNVRLSRSSLIHSFVERSKILTKMKEDLLASELIGEHFVGVLTGFGGVGKTQLALKFAEEFHKIYPEAPLFFFNASSERELMEHLQAVIPQKDSTSKSYSAHEGLRWLNDLKTPWLAIYDAADDISLELHSWLANRGGHGISIITSRNEFSGLQYQNHHYLVDAMEKDEAVQLLRNSTNAKLPFEEFEPYALDIVKCLGYHALLIVHAGAYINLHPPLKDFLNVYRENGLDLLTGKELLTHRHYDKTIICTLNLSFSQLTESAKSLLYLFSSAKSCGVALDLLVEAARRQFHISFSQMPQNQEFEEKQRDLSELLCPEGSWSKANFDRLTDSIREYSFLQVLADENGEVSYKWHDVVAEWLKAKIAEQPGEQARFHNLWVHLLATVAVSTNHITSKRNIITHIQDLFLENTSIDSAYCVIFAQFYAEYRLWPLAADWYDRAVQNPQKDKATQDKPREMLIQLAEASLKAGNRTKTIKIGSEILEETVRIHGMNSFETLRVRQMIARAYYDEHNYDRVIELFKINLDAIKLIYGPESSNFLRCRTNIASAYSKKGDFEAAIEEYFAILQLQRCKKLDWDTFICMSHLAECYYLKSDHDSAIKWHTEALSGFEALNENENILFTKESLGIIHQERGSIEDLNIAINHFTQVLEARQKLGSDHPETLDAKLRLASAFIDYGRYQEGLSLAMIAGISSAPGRNKSESIRATLALAFVSYEVEAYEIFIEAATLIRELNLTSNDFYYPVANCIIGILLGYQNAFDDAIDVQEDALKVLRSSPVHFHREKLRGMRCLAKTYTNAGQLERARVLEIEALPLFESTYGKNHLYTLLLQGQIGMTLEALNNLVEAEQIQRDVLRRQERHLRHGHPKTLKTMERLDALMNKMGKGQFPGLHLFEDQRSNEFRIAFYVSAWAFFEAAKMLIGLEYLLIRLLFLPVFMTLHN